MWCSDVQGACPCRPWCLTRRGSTAGTGGVVCRRMEVTIPYWPPPWKSPPGTLKADSLSLRTELWATCRNEEHVVQGAVIYLKDKVEHACKGLETVLVTCIDTLLSWKLLTVNRPVWNPCFLWDSVRFHFKWGEKCTLRSQRGGSESRGDCHSANDLNFSSATT